MSEFFIDVCYDEEHDVRVAIFDIEGDIDVNTSKQFEAAVKTAYEAGERYALLDLNGVPYVSSAGLRSLHRVFTLLRSEESKESNAAMRRGLRDGSFKSEHLKLLQPQAEVADLLKTAGFDMYLEIYDDREEALAAFG